MTPELREALATLRELVADLRELDAVAPMTRWKQGFDHDTGDAEAGAALDASKRQEERVCQQAIRVAEASITKR